MIKNITDESIFEICRKVGIDGYNELFRFAREIIAADRTLNAADLDVGQRSASTPSSQWSADGESDPHEKRYDCERAALCMGNLTDDELANGAFMNYDAPLDLHGIMAGRVHSPIAWMTAVKDRIRWLSRALERTLAAASRPADRDVMRQSIVDDIDAILYQCDRGNTSLPWLLDCVRGLRERIAAPTPPAEQGEQEPLTDSYVQRVPDKCDRITWRNRYYSLPLNQSLAELRAKVEALQWRDAKGNLICTDVYQKRVLAEIDKLGGTV